MSELEQIFRKHNKKYPNKEEWLEAIMKDLQTWKDGDKKTPTEEKKVSEEIGQVTALSIEERLKRLETEVFFEADKLE